jgi:poly-beta-1,6-N-acetyl-D-glucosamine synthase
MNDLCVLLPAKDECLGIEKTLRSILRAGVSPSDIYVVDDGSSDGTGEIAGALAINVLQNPKNIGKAHSIRRGAREFQLVERYEYVCLMDADTEVCENYFAVVRKTFADPSVVAVCGRAKSTPHNWLTAYRSLAYWMSHAIYKAGQSNMNVITVAPGCASSFRSAAFAQLEWNSDTIVEDMDCTIQIHRKHLGRIVYQKDALVSTQDPRTLRDYAKQLYRWDTGTWQTGKKYALWTGRDRIDWEFKLLMGEGLLFSMLYLLMPVWVTFYPRVALFGIGLDWLVFIVLALACAVSDDRMDVFYCSPLYVIMRFVDCSVFIYSYWNTVVRRQHVRRWFAAARYLF